jgi:hypothetical protein
MDFTNGYFTHSLLFSEYLVNKNGYFKLEHAKMINKYYCISFTIGKRLIKMPTGYRRFTTGSFPNPQLLDRRGGKASFVVFGGFTIFVVTFLRKLVGPFFDLTDCS